MSRSKQLIGILSLGDLAVRAQQDGEEWDLAEEALKDISEPSEPRR
jgi:hypothetical protein